MSEWVKKNGVLIKRLMYVGDDVVYAIDNENTIKIVKRGKNSEEIEKLIELLDAPFIAIISAKIEQDYKAKKIKNNRITDDYVRRFFYDMIAWFYPPYVINVISKWGLKFKSEYSKHHENVACGVVGDIVGKEIYERAMIRLRELVEIHYNIIRYNQDNKITLGMVNVNKRKFRFE